MIIFGSRTMAKLLATLYFVCRNCGNPAAQQLVKRSTWFTLFFIPVFPFRITHSTTCTFCGAGTKVSKAEADQMLAANQQGPAPQQQGWPQQGRQQPQQGNPQPPRQY